MAKNKGFTLIEIMIVIAIIAFVLILSFMYIFTQLGKGRDAKRKSDIYYIKSAVEEYEKDNDCYPSYLPSCYSDEGNFLKPYLDKIPCDPVSKTNYLYIPDPENIVCPRWFWVFARFDNLNDPQIEDLGCGNKCGPSDDWLYYDYYQTSPNAPEPAKGVVPPPSTEPRPSCTDLWGCFSGACEQICSHGGGICQPNFWKDPTCGGGICQDASGNPQNECN